MIFTESRLPAGATQKGVGSMAFDFKKEYKDLYAPSAKPVLIDVPPMVFILVDGAGDPNAPGGEYSEAMEILYGFSYAVKMSKLSGAVLPGSFDSVVPPLEGLWHIDGYVFDGGSPIADKSKFQWTSMIRQPEFVTQDVFEATKAALQKRRPGLPLEKARLETVAEGLCAQVMHIGPYDAEPPTIAKLDAFIRESGYVPDLDGARRHHEIYLGDPRKTAPEKRRTVIRHPVRMA